MTRCLEGHWIPNDAPENLCPECLLSVPLPATKPRRVGSFQLLELLGEGGFGLVYLAQRDGTEDCVALKVLRSLEFADLRSVAQFRREPTLSAKLDARYVVQVLEVGEHEGLPYFTMEYMAFGTLRARMAEYRHAPRQAAQLMIEIATAAQYLHHDPRNPERESILHRDLKPENILFGADGRPRISDFGIAKLAAKGGTWTFGTRPVGCPCYMAPEQLYPSQNGALTAGADVYALGAILYELFVGRPPFDGTDAEIRDQSKEGEAVPPSRLAPGLDRFLDAVVLNALERDPNRRYRSAAAFAQDLQRALEQKAPEERPLVAPATRVRTWLRKHRVASFASLWLVSALLVVAASVRSSLRARIDELERDQQTNAAVAGMQAVAVNLQLRAYKHRIAELAEDPEILGLLDEPSLPYPAKLRACLAPFDTLFVIGPDGVQRSRTSVKSSEYLRRTFAFRDYFEGARRLGLEHCAHAADSSHSRSPVAYVARAYTSESDGHFEFAISAPLCKGQRWVGLVAGSIATDKVLGAVQLLDDHHGRVAAVLGPRDRERGAPLPLPNDLTFIVHPGLRHGQALALQRPDPATLRAALGISSLAQGGEGAGAGPLRYSPPLRVDEYRDPVPGFEGVWSAVFAAADESGYLIAVQSRRDGSPLGQAVAAKLWPAAGVPFGVALLLLVAVHFAAARPRAVKDRRSRR